MNKAEIASMTVLELRKLAREYKVTLSAGINKAEIVERVSRAVEAAEASANEEQQSFLPSETETAPAPAPEQDSAPEQAEEAAAAEEPAQAAPAQAAQRIPAPEAPAESAPEASQPQFKAAWHNPSNRYTNNRSGGYGQRSQPSPQVTSPWQSRPQQDGPTAPGRAAYPHRFGPDPSSDPAPAPAPQETPAWREEPARPANNGFSGGFNTRSFDSPQESAPRGGYTGGYRSAPRQSYDRGGYSQRQTGFSGGNSSFNQSPAPRPSAPQQADAGEWINPADCPDVTGLIDLHPDGYGFMRSMSFLSSSRDLYVPAPLIKRYGLRNGDVVTGKLKPQRDGEKYPSLLTVSVINDVPADVQLDRPYFDDDIERLGADYPQKRFKLDAAGSRDMRAIDLVAPMGFGQRALLLCPQDAHRTVTLRNLANAITASHPEAEVIIVLFGGTPEDATRMRDHVSCRVLAATFDQPAENQLRMCDLLLEYAKRRVEMKKDIVLLVDSLTRLSKACPTAAAQQGRAAVGVVNPGSLNRAKRLFGTANAFRAGGSLTVVGVMNLESSRVDDAIYEEFKTAANCILSLDSAIARAGIYPALNINQSGTRKQEGMIPQQEIDLQRSLRAALSGVSPAEAISQLLSMIDRVPTNAELRQKLPDWLNMMRSDGRGRA